MLIHPARSRETYTCITVTGRPTCMTVTGRPTCITETGTLKKICQKNSRSKSCFIQRQHVQTCPHRLQHSLQRTDWTSGTHIVQPGEAYDAHWGDDHMCASQQSCHKGTMVTKGYNGYNGYKGYKGTHQPNRAQVACQRQYAGVRTLPSSRNDCPLSKNVCCEHN